MNPGDDVLVDFDGKEHRGEIVSVSKGYVLAVIVTDPCWDYGTLSPRLVPHSTVCVPESRVKPWPDA